MLFNLILQATEHSVRWREHSITGTCARCGVPSGCRVRTGPTRHLLTDWAQTCTGVLCWRSLIRALAVLQMFLLAQSASPAGSTQPLHLSWYGDTVKPLEMMYMEVNWRWTTHKAAELSVLPERQSPPSEIHEPPRRSSATWATSLGHRPPCYSSHLLWMQLWQLRYY